MKRMPLSRSLQPRFLFSLAAAIVRGAFSFLSTLREDERLDRQLGVRTGHRPSSRITAGVYLAHKTERSGARHADGLDYGASPYRTLEAIADALSPGPGDVFVDAGCGDGRALCLMAFRGAGRCIGLELDPELAELARANARSLRGGVGSRIEVVRADASRPAAPLLDEATILFLFHPFGLRSVRDLIDRLEESFRRKPRKLTIAYHNAIERWYLDDAPWLERDDSLHDARVLLWRTRPEALS